MVRNTRTRKSYVRLAVDAIKRGAMAHADGDAEEAVRLLTVALSELIHDEFPSD